MFFCHPPLKTLFFALCIRCSNLPQEQNSISLLYFMQKLFFKNNRFFCGIFQVFGICTESAPYLMIVEYLPKGDLRRYLLGAKERGVTFQQLLSICENVSF